MASHAYHHGDLRRSLLATAAAVVAEHGVQAASLREVARRAGVSHAAPAHHFRDKGGLLAALAADGHRLLAERLARAAEQPDPGQALLAAGRAYLALARQRPGHFAVMTRCDLADPAEDAELAAAGEASAAVMRGIVARLDPDGAGAGATADLAWGLAHGLAMLEASGAFGAPERAQERAEAAMAALIARLGA